MLKRFPDGQPDVAGRISVGIESGAPKKMELAPRGLSDTRPSDPLDGGVLGTGDEVGLAERAEFKAVLRVSNDSKTSVSVEL